MAAKNKFDPEAGIAAILRSAKPEHISEALARERFSNPDGSGTDNLLAKALLTIEQGRGTFENYLSESFRIAPDPVLNTAWVRGIATISQFLLSQLTMILKYSRPVPDTLGNETYEHYDSERKLMEVAVQLTKLIVAFHQATRYIHAVQHSSASKNDIYAELVVAKNDQLLDFFYTTLKVEIPEYNSALTPETDRN